MCELCMKLYLVYENVTKITKELLGVTTSFVFFVFMTKRSQ